MRVFTFKAEEKEINRFYLVCIEEGVYTMSECIRMLIRRYILEHEERPKKKIKVRKVVLK